MKHGVRLLKPALFTLNPTANEAWSKNIKTIMAHVYFFVVFLTAGRNTNTSTPPDIKVPIITNIHWNQLNCITHNI